MTKKVINLIVRTVLYRIKILFLMTFSLNPLICRQRHSTSPGLKKADMRDKAELAVKDPTGNNKDESDEDFHESRKETVGKAPNKMASHARQRHSTSPGLKKADMRDKAQFAVNDPTGNSEDESDEDFYESRKETVGKAPRKTTSHARQRHSTSPGLKKAQLAVEDESDENLSESEGEQA